MNSFHTESSSRKNVGAILYTYFGLALLSLLGLKIAVITCLYFEAVALISALMCFFAVSKTRWIMDFHDNTLLLTNTGNKKQYYIDNLSASDFHFKQSKKQRSANRCDLTLADYSFKLYDVNNYEELKQYVLAAFQR